MFCVIICHAEWGIFGIGPDIDTPTGDPATQTIAPEVWTPMDKVWVYQPCNTALPPKCNGHIVYYVVYVNNSGHHKVEEVDIDTWYATGWERTNYDMYFQGGRA